MLKGHNLGVAGPSPLSSLCVCVRLSAICFGAMADGRGEVFIVHFHVACACSSRASETMIHKVFYDSKVLSLDLVLLHA